MANHPSDMEYKKMVINKLLPNFPVTVKYISNEKSTLGLYLVGMIGKTVRRKPNRLDTEEFVAIMMAS